MVFGIIGFIFCIAYIAAPQRFYKLEIVAGFFIFSIAVLIIFDFVSHSPQTAVLPPALWAIAAYVWLHDGFANRRAVKRRREEPPK